MRNDGFDFSCKVIIPTDISLGKHVVFRPGIVQKGKGIFPWVPQRNQPKGNTMVHNNGILEGTKAGHLRGLGRAPLKGGQDQELRALQGMISFGPVPFGKAFFHILVFLVQVFLLNKLDQLVTSSNKHYIEQISCIELLQVSFRSALKLYEFT